MWQKVGEKNGVKFFSVFPPRYFTLLLFSSFSSVTNFDCADADYDGHDEEEDASNEARSDGSSLDVLRHGVPGESQH